MSTGKTISTLTHHKKAVRSLTAASKELTFVSASADNIKKWQIRDGKFLKNYSGHNSVINSVCNNEDGVLVSAADNGSLHFWDYDTGYNFQSTKTIVQPGIASATLVTVQ
jgi:pleiotropic regulator 1